MARNCGGQHQRRPRLSLMGLAESSILIRSLSLKLEDWPLYLHEPCSCRTTQPTPASIWPRGSSHSAQMTFANQQHVQGALAAKPLHSLHIHPYLYPMGSSSFCISPAFLFSFSLCLNPYFLFFLPPVPVFIWPSRPPSLPHHTHLSYPGNEDEE